MSDKPPSPADQKPASYGDDDMTRASGWDALLDDLFGLNVRALKTVAAALFSPARLFEAARDVDWLGRYTPSIRLVFTLIAAVVFLKFLWVNDTSGLFAYTQATMEAMGTEFPGRTPEEAARDYLAALLVTYPFSYFGVHAVFALMLNIWGKGTPLAVRIRLYFAGLLPVLLAGVLMTLVYAGLSAEALDQTMVIGFGLMLGLYFLTLYRGLGPVHRGAGRAGRSALGAVVMMGGDLVVSAVSSLWAVTLLFAGAS
ncbi:hypothetical protein BBF93_11365 [Hyphomonas sp. CACIAM 19H1]|uniref:hypothetical protein n=1 Tax=Hyphomonas sp. CACIAM 19H1 TaxID=1873716 RepID=UPI000DED9693|nr:hypothetical protein [Hyphomonas sp. CACIAM 19H1]AXE64757.1 hypothetical protein BBF93_11365 [Hyphomonas sp. CACIAM 19H1]